ncbi:hypothetical protein [Accumulibacter sp.]|uniref:hypothetical protein n=1 Tax=Accumulibacter sp. TaxID=2053492 RepID=UPI00260D8624|nr:hypothetical protein [Accumulibacter sp.]
MLLKARLMKEHWSLIVSKPDQANLTKFMAGDFISVTLEDCRARIRDVAGEDIGDDAYNSFRALANHRNKMVHFFHQGLDSDEKAKAQIVAEHCRSWFHLHRLLNRWGGYFHDFGSEIAHADRAMKGHRKYLAAKFKALKPELDAARKAGSAPKACSACGFKAAIPDALDDQIASLRCLVCDHTETQVELECPHCGESVVLANEGYATCDHCGGSIEPEHLVDVLTKDVVGTKDYFETGLPANCGTCEGYHTVVERDDMYFCANCFELSDHVEQCEWCNELNTGDMEHSYSVGCSHCDGKVGWEKDDD